MSDNRVNNNVYGARIGKQYFGRGPMFLRWHNQYGSFGQALYPDIENGAQVLLTNPDLVIADSETAFISAFWLIMVGSSEKPSPHDIAIGRWQPSASEAARGL